MAARAHSVYGSDGLLKLRPAIDPKKGRIPAESLVLDDWRRGRTSAEMAKAYGVDETSIHKFVRPRLKRWKGLTG